jgi:hypothetical protein
MGGNPLPGFPQQVLRETREKSCDSRTNGFVKRKFGAIALKGEIYYESDTHNF